MATIPANTPRATQATRRARIGSLIQRQGVLIAFALLLAFGALRYENFLGVYNIASVIRSNSMIALCALGMCFVIMTGGIDLSVGSVAALASVVAAKLSGQNIAISILVPVLVGTLVGFLNGTLIAKLHILPFIVTLAMLLGARGLALVIADNRSVAVPLASSLRLFGGNVGAVPNSAFVLFGAYLVGSLLLNYTRWGRHVLAVGGNEEAARLMGLRVDWIKIAVYTLSGTLAALAGVILAAQYGAGQPTEGLGWELAAIASVVVGGTLLTGGLGSVGTTLVGALLLGLIFNILNFENGRGTISLSSYWQSVIRGLFLLVVVVLQNRLARQRE